MRISRKRKVLWHLHCAWHKEGQGGGETILSLGQYFRSAQAFLERCQGGRCKDPHVPSRIFTAGEVPIPGFLFDDPKVREELALYYSSVQRADDCVGEILKALSMPAAKPTTQW